MATIRDIVTDALREIGVVAGTETPSASDASIGLNKLTRLFNNWNAERRAVYATAFSTFTLSPGVAPHTIGPTAATFTVAQRPVSIDGASLILTGDSDVYVPIAIRDAEWWHAQTVPDLESTVPTDLYYQPDWPNGQIYFWPVPTTAYQVELMIRVLLDDAVVLADTFSLPPGYQDAVTLTLAEMLLTPFGVAPPPTLAKDAKLARSRIFGNNEQPTRIQTNDAGMEGPKSSGRRADFNWLTGQVL
jgi:hypothetical protein